MLLFTNSLSKLGILLSFVQQIDKYYQNSSLYSTRFGLYKLKNDTINQGLPGKHNKLNNYNSNYLVNRLYYLNRMTHWTTDLVRSTFIDYFTGKKYYGCDVVKHSFIKGTAVTPKNDPTLLFINAGMNQFKDLFIGNCKPGDPLLKIKQATNSQICIRYIIR